MRDRLPPLPGIGVALVEDATGRSRLDEGFLTLRRLRLENRYADGARSASYAYDVVEREALDAVCVLLSAPGPDEPFVLLRSALRPPLAFRAGRPLPLPHAHGEVLWELPAGLVEHDEVGDVGLRRCASREVLEETGFSLEPEAFEALGAPVFLSPGVIAEKVHFLAARVEPSLRGLPTEDGTPTEERAEIAMIPLSEALAACERGEIADAKTELGLLRFARARGTR